MVFFFSSRELLPWLRLQVSTCSQERRCCPGGLGSPSAFSHQWPIYRWAGSHPANTKVLSSYVHANFCLCSLGCSGHLHPFTLRPHSTGSNSPVRLRGSSVSGHLGSSRAPENAQITIFCFRDMTEMTLISHASSVRVGISQWTFG